MPDLNEWTEKWSGFETKVRARIEGIADEASQAFADVAAVDPLDPAPIAQIEMALQGRMNGLTDRIDEAFETIDEGLDELIDDEERPRALARLTAARDEMSEQRDALSDFAQRTEERCKVLNAAVIGRALRALAEAEDRTQTCVQCGSPFDPGEVYQSTAVSCPGCSARVTVGPKPATLQWYSRGVSGIADADALADWEAWQDAEHLYNALRHPTPRDMQALEDAYRRYNETRFETMVALHPAWTADKAAEQIEGRCSQLRKLQTGYTGASMDRTSEGLEIARTRNVAKLSQWAATATTTPEGRHLLLDDLLEAAAERSDRPAAETLVQLVHRDEMPRWFGKQRWMKGKLAELSPSFA